MTFKEELDQIFKPVIEYLVAIDTGFYPESLTEFKVGDEALASIINLVDKELPEKKRDFPYPGENIQAASHAGYNQAISEMRAKLKGDK